MITVNNTQYTISLVRNEEEAKEVSDFFYSKKSFDDRNFTPGELEHMKTCTFESIADSSFYYWYAKDHEGNIIGALGVKENPQKSGGYTGDYCVVHKDYRNKGIAVEMHKIMFDFLTSIGARYMLVETCDTDYYKPIRRLLAEMGFKQVGHCPDYYFDGEGLLWYLKTFSKAFRERGS